MGRKNEVSALEKALYELCNTHKLYGVEQVRVTPKGVDFVTSGLASYSFFKGLAELVGCPIESIRVEGETIHEGYCETCAYYRAGMHVYAVKE